nr:uncharacterized protein LOC102452068 [Pelodiscus sinensis]|eukprot:XP_006122718.2 uncharacterized protein LOC102452068 [Pelodiscus sinensis]
MGEEKEEDRRESGSLRLSIPLDGGISICSMLWSNCCKHKIFIIGAGVGTIAVLCCWKVVKLMKENEELQKEKLILKEQIEELQKEKLTLKERNDQLQKENEWRKARNETDDIILDAVTAHPNLSISSNKKSFTHEAQPQNVPPNPERFDASVCVLGSERFSNGKHYWELDQPSLRGEPHKPRQPTETREATSRGTNTGNLTPYNIAITEDSEGYFSIRQGTSLSTAFGKNKQIREQKNILIPTKSV